MDQSSQLRPDDADGRVSLFLCGDVMMGRGIDQILPHPSDPTLHERAVEEATRYVELAERESGPIPRGVDFEYVWGDALDVLDSVSPDLRIVNLETAVTTSDAYWEGKAIHYRMNPQNIPSLTAAGIDCCILANNHVLDWGYAGLEETLQTLEAARIETVGAGRSLQEAQRPAVFEVPDRGRVLVFGVGSTSSGIPPQWAATENRPGVHLVDESSPNAAARVERVIEQFARPEDIVVVSVHWGPNWSYKISGAQQGFARTLIEEAGVDILHGHSSHHVKGIGMHNDRPILYGCGDFLTDYEGIAGREQFRGELGLMYFVHLNADTQTLASLEMRPTRVEQFQVTHAAPEEAEWLAQVLNRESQKLGVGVELLEKEVLTLREG